MAKVTMYTTAICPFCVSAKRLLASKGIVNITEVRVDREPAKRKEMMAKSGQRTVPQIWIGERHVGGFTDLSALDKRGELDPLLAS
ncbi:glutaredoxin 3 [uncultured Gilvimarinus sp.]|jgi:glutaredoxin 3|uniref:glutaredoxin 3 n=1 Tax=uncultured Gilvimarinus sp. TaxID=1689143 RepID=UPI0030DB57EA|tara:strand:+ start:79 stop:336 length:258 start_codon:yes stop_codon:yes gene_type:complete